MVPQSIYDGIAALAAAVKSLGALPTATRYDIAIVRVQADDLVDAIDAALSAACGNLDAGDPVLFAGDLPAYLINLQGAAADQTNLADKRGLVGRAAFNIAQA